MNIKKKLLRSIGIPFILSIIIALILVLLITKINVTKEIERSILRQHNVIVDHVSNIVSNSAKSYMKALSDITITDPTVLKNITKKNFLINGYIYLVNRDGIITDHPDIDKIGQESINKSWLLSTNIENSEFYKYRYEERDKLLYKYYNKEIDRFVITSAYVDDFSNTINIQDLRDSMEKVKIGSTGYAFILTIDGLCLTHPNKNLLNTNLKEVQDADGNFIYKRIFSELNGHFTYNFITENGTTRTKNMYYSYDKNSKLIICSTSYIDEYYESLNDTIKIIILCGILIILISSLILFNVSESFVKPIERLSELSIEITKGNLNQSFSKGKTREINTLGENFIFMQNSIKNNMENLEEAVNRKTEELQKAQAHLILSEKMSSLGSLVAGVAHEINTPIGIGVTAASHLEKETNLFIEKYKNGEMTKSSFEKYMENTNIESKMLLSNMNRAATLVQSFKKVSVDQTIELKRKFNVKEYIEELLLSLKHKLKSKEITIIIDCKDDIVINSYPGPLSQILTNLILNSFLHGFDNLDRGEILISIRKNDKELELQFSDDGLGIPEEYIHRIFEPFFTTKRNSGGTGLGLHLVYNIVITTLNGTISCNNREQKGSQFIIKFPIMA